MKTPPPGDTTARFEVVEHTAETGILAHGRTPGEIFANAAYGMFSLMTDLARVRPRGEYQIRLRAPDPGALMVDWLTQLLFLHETEDLYLSEFDVEVSDTSLEAKVRGERIDRRRHPPKTAVKAVTYHQLEVDLGGGYARIIFDI